MHRDSNAMIHVHPRPAPLPDGRTATVYRLHAEGGIAVEVASLGATLLTIAAPDRAGVPAPVLLGSGDPARYPAAGAAGPDAYLGATCGRFANRIAGARFTLDGVEHILAANEAPNQLHGGPTGFHRALWDAEPLPDGVRLRHRSPHGDQGFPGTLDAVAEFRLIDPHTLAIRYRATTDRPTHVNLVSHGYFNLSGDAATPILDHRLEIAADAYLPIDAQALPLGGPSPVAGTPFDFRTPRRIGDAIDGEDAQLRVGDGYNHNFVLRRPGLSAPAARLHDPASGRTLTLHTDQPGLQLYSGNALDGSFSSAPGAPGYGRRSGLCLEAQHWPDSPNRPDFPATRLDPGESYVSETWLRFGSEG